MENSSDQVQKNFKPRKQHKKDLKKKLRRRNKKKWELEAEEAKDLQSRYDSIKPEDINSFADFPLCKKTQKGLQDAGYELPTEIQKSSIGLALQGCDILGAAKTGSGKTLAFLIPMLECLFRDRWTAEDGLGVLIISPTRELAYQTFEALFKIGKQHEFSAGLVIGGKDVEEEAAQICRTNIVVCTPGRLLQHLDTTPDFECRNLKMLVLDEADRILDLGFMTTMNAILEHIPAQRQTLLFSATQTKSVKDLARLSLQDPKYVAVHEHHEHSTPAQLEQVSRERKRLSEKDSPATFLALICFRSYIVCELHQKINILFSFIKAHRTKKILVFMATCKQVKFAFEVFCKLRPGTTVMALYGTLHQLRRVSIYKEFCEKPSAVLFATDIAARGLDFPAVHWVVQLDCPEDASTYIHRVGRTARYQENGESLLFLLPSEEYAMVKQLNDRKIPIQKIEVNPNKKMVIYRKLQSYCAQDPEVKESGKRSFVSYIKSVFLMKNKDVFDVSKLPLEEFAISLGLPFTPRVRFLEKRQKEQLKKSQGKDVSGGRGNGGAETGDLSLVDGKKGASVPSREEFYGEGKDWRREKRLRELKEMKPASDDDDNDDDLLVMKKENVFGISDLESAGDADEFEAIKETMGKKGKPLTKVAALKKLAKEQRNTKVLFKDSEGVGDKDSEDLDEEYEKGLDLKEAQEYMKRADEEDKKRFRERIRAKHKEERLKKKQAKQKKEEDEESDDEGDTVAQLDLDNDYEEFDPSKLPDPMSDSEDEDSNGDDEEKEEESEEEEGESEEDGEAESSENEKQGVNPHDEDTSSSSSSDESEERPARRKRKQLQKPVDLKQKRKKMKVTPEVETGLSLDDEEQLALHILSSNR